MFNHGYSPYGNNIFHSSPILLQFFAFIESFDDLKFFNDNIFNLTNISFILFDLIVCYNLYYIAKHFQCYLMKHLVFKYNENHTKNKFTTSLHSSKYFALIIASLYNFNPFIIAVCVSKSNSNVIHALSTTAIIISMNFNFNFNFTKSRPHKHKDKHKHKNKNKDKTNNKNKKRNNNGKIVLSSFILALATVIDVYPIMLVPLCIQFICLDANGYNKDVIRHEKLKEQEEEQMIKDKAKNQKHHNIKNENENKNKNKNKNENSSSGGVSIKICIFYLLCYVIGVVFFFNYNVLFLQSNKEEPNETNWQFIREFYFFMFEVCLYPIFFFFFFFFWVVDSEIQKKPKKQKIQRTKTTTTTTTTTTGK